MSRIFSIPSASRALHVEERQQWLSALDIAEPLPIPDNPGVHQT